MRLVILILFLVLIVMAWLGGCSEERATGPIGGEKAYLGNQPDPEGLVVDVAAMRLLHFAGGPPEVYAVAVGDAADPTVLGSFRVGAKRVDPVWNVPESIRRKKPHLPAQVPPGPDNPLGSRWITIGRTSYGIHGTNDPKSIGRAASSGFCSPFTTAA